MKGSTAPLRVAFRRQAVLIALLDVAARLGVPLALLALANRLGEMALLAAASVNVLAVARGVLIGRLIAQSLRQGWARFVRAARGHSVMALRTRTAQQSAAMFVDAVHRSAMTYAQVLPRLLADGVGLLLCAVLVVWLLGWFWLLLGGALLLLVAPPLVWAQRRMRRHEQRSYNELAELSLDVATLIDAPAELRAHGVEGAFAAAMAQRCQRMAVDMQRSHMLSSMLALLPLGIALLAALLPLRDGGWLSGQLLTMAQAAVLGATAVSLGLSLARGSEAWQRSAPQRNLYDGFLSAADVGEMDAAYGSIPPDSGWKGTITFDELSVRYPGAEHCTPAVVSYDWPEGEGLAVLGANGAGKSSLALVLMGLLDAHSGRISVGGKVLMAVRPRVRYLPQQPYLEATRSIGWHLRLVCGEAQSDEALRAGLEEVGLWPLLQRRAAGRGVAPLSLPAGELSGGERQRMHLARAFVAAPSGGALLVVLDEPEAALDKVGRVLLAKLLEQLTPRARVLLIAHDDGVVPASFARLHVEQG